MVKMVFRVIGRPFELFLCSIYIKSEEIWTLQLSKFVMITH